MCHPVQGMYSDSDVFAKPVDHSLGRPVLDASLAMAKFQKTPTTQQLRVFAMSVHPFAAHRELRPHLWSVEEEEQVVKYVEKRARAQLTD